MILTLETALRVRGAVLGAQRLKPTLGQAMVACEFSGRMAVVTAGWQEREEIDTNLLQACGPGAVNLKLYARSEKVLAADRPLAAAHKVRQERLKRAQSFYRMRLEGTVETHLDIARRAKGSSFEEEEFETTMQTIRALDADHLLRVRDFTSEYEERLRPLERPAVAAEREALRAILGDCEGLAIAGGHVAVLLNRLRLFGLLDLLAGQMLFCWSGGAMACTERVLLFHDSPPQGVGVAEFMDDGLGLLPGLVALPHPRQRLVLDEPWRVTWLARRLAPARAVIFDDGEFVRFDGRRYFDAHGTKQVTIEGTFDSEWA